jgi:hypothetical protein
MPSVAEARTWDASPVDQVGFPLESEITEGSRWLSCSQHSLPVSHIAHHVLGLFSRVFSSDPAGVSEIYPLPQRISA